MTDLDIEQRRDHDIIASWCQTPRGLPRPRSTDGRNLPVPYIASGPNQLGTTNAQRILLCVIDKRCQVCGEVIEGDAVLVSDTGLAPIDKAPICAGRCWTMARRLCPALAALIDQGRLLMWTIDAAFLTANADGDAIAIPDVPGELVPPPSTPVGNLG